MVQDALSPDEASLRLREVGRRIEAALKKASRPPGTVALLAVSKTFPAPAVRVLLDAGQKLFGESYIQEAREKIPQVGGDADWHYIGHLQTNKARYAAQLFSAVHALDSLELAAELNKRLIALDRKLSCYVQVNVSGEETKSGIEPAGLPNFLDALSAYAALVPEGLMTMPPYDPDPEASRPYFRRLYELKEHGAPSLKGLSMGMSGDFEVAIEEGATVVRVGTLLFGSRV
ncbi:MAG: YggS family pyridoxal phosphate-dependent enzyme [Deltaproteobacteria bacterium]|jgi:pyridoxal phosphate enzyme (YggS family)|nr:YggS family pyridoxal phosphate-dependent enzyme [Deltaproteobacteria bacterium]